VIGITRFPTAETGDRQARDLRRKATATGVADIGNRACTKISDR
jgi:hypothetical protein